MYNYEPSDYDLEHPYHQKPRRFEVGALHGQQGWAPQATDDEYLEGHAFGLQQSPYLEAINTIDIPATDPVPDPEPEP